MSQEESICTRKIDDIYNTYRMKLCQNDHTESQWLLTTKCHTQIKNTFYSIDLICIFIGGKAHTTYDVNRNMYISQS